ncbi:glycoside hydrolase family 15 protein [Streptomyces avermitilis]|uniref:glycoside hydrolase family 15 protein n=1 Tax=Streptomyces avermitilis TaxID=33903 RepID=UPI0037F17748
MPPAHPADPEQPGAPPTAHRTGQSGAEPEPGQSRARGREAGAGAEHGTGERDLQERELRRLPGYENSGPVRIGSGAANQLQLDVYGYVIETLYLAHQSGVARCGDTAVLHQRLVEHLAERWQMPDEGIWEVRGERRHFVHSKVMAWAAVDRTLRLVEAGALDADCAL